MARLPVIDPATSSPAAKAIFDGALKGKHFNLFKGLANSPAALEAYVAFSGALAKGSLTAGEREIVALTVAEANNCGYCIAAHTTIGKMVGLTEGQTIEARRGTMPDAKLNGLVKFTLALHEKRGFVSDADIANFKQAGYGDGHIAEVAANYALNTYTNYFNHLNGTTVDFPAVAKI